MKFKSTTIFAATVFTLLISACSESNFSSGPGLRTEDAAKKGMRLEVGPSGKSINIGQAQTFTATLITGDSEKKDVSSEAKWKINAAKLASIDSKGTLKAKAAGQVAVMASYRGMNASATLAIVDVSLKEIRVMPALESVLIGGSVIYTATGVFGDGLEEDITEKATWKTSDPQVAFMQENIANGVTVGISTISASFEGQEGSVSLEVKQVNPEKLEITPLNLSMPIGMKEPYTAIVTFSDGSTKDVTKETQWSIVDSVIARFSTIDSENHILETLKPGSSIIEAKYLELTASTTVTVNEALVLSVAVTPDQSTVKVGANQVYAAKATFSDGQIRDVTTDAVWTSLDNSIATISNDSLSSGLATAVSHGATKIIAVYRFIPSNEATLTVPKSDGINFGLAINKSGNGAGTVMSNPAGISCGNDCSKSFPADTQLTITATSTADSEFVSWGGACSGNGACVVKMGSAKAVSATFALKKFTLSATKSGKGVIKASGIDCGNDCSEAYNVNETIALTATPDADSEFDAWSGACSGKAACTVAMSANKSVSATFILKKFDLTVTKVGNGSVTGSSINCGAECTKKFDSGTTVTLTATPATDSTFTGWSGACTGATCAITMSEAKNAIATFALKKYALSVTKNGNGSVLAAGIDCGSDCAEIYGIGTNVALTATPASDSIFVNWEGACSGTTSCSVTMNEAKAVTANFALKRFTLSVAKTGVGTVTGSGISCGATCSETYNIDTAVSLTATPDAKYTFSNWSGACSGSAVCNISMAEAKSVSAVFVLKKFTLTAATSGNGKVTATGIDCGTDCNETYDTHTNVTLSHSASLGSAFAGWSGACSGSGACVVSMSESRNVTASFKINCDVNAVENVAATFNTPLGIAYKTGDMDRKTLDSLPDEKLRLQRLVNQQCIDNFDPTVDSRKWTNPAISADTDTRDAICQLYGYQKATTSFGYYQFATPKDDHVGTWLTATKRMFVNKDASSAPSFNKILVWTGCSGKLYNSCTNTFKSDFRCKN